MGALIKMSDGEPIVLNSDLNGIVGVLAEALERQGTTTDDQGRALPKGFVRFDTLDGRELVVNAAQVAYVGRPEQAPREFRVLDQPGIAR